MNAITVYLHNGELKHEWDGHYYNEHVLKKEIVESANPSSDMKEMEVYCAMCEESHGERLYTDEDWRIDILYTYLCGKFDTPCPVPKGKISAAAKSAWKQYEGQTLTDEVRMDMVDQIRDACDEHVQVNFE